MFSVVARRSVALPFPSSPHCAPRTTIAGIGPPLGARLGHRLRALPAARAVATILHGGRVAVPVSARVRRVDPLLLITNADAGTTDAQALDDALSILREKCSV